MFTNLMHQVGEALFAECGAHTQAHACVCAPQYQRWMLQRIRTIGWASESALRKQVCAYSFGHAYTPTPPKLSPSSLPPALPPSRSALSPPLCSTEQRHGLSIRNRHFSTSGASLPRPPTLPWSPSEGVCLAPLIPQPLAPLKPQAHHTRTDMHLDIQQTA